MDFQEVERRYAELKRQRDAGTLSDEEFESRLKQLMVRDGEGRWWAKSPTSGEWHYHDGTRFVRGNPHAGNRLNGFVESTTWKRTEVLSAVAALVAAIALVATGITDTIVAIAPGDAWGLVVSRWMFAIASVCALGALVGLHARQAKSYSYGRLGLIGFLITSLAYVSFIVAYFVPVQSVTILRILGYSVAVGLVPLGIATLRAGVLPSWCGLAMIFTAIVDSVLTILYQFIITNYGVSTAIGISFAFLYALLWLVVGYALWSRRHVQPTEVRQLS